MHGLFGGDMAKLPLFCDSTKVATITPPVHDSAADPLTPARTLRLALFTLMFLVGGVMLLMRLFYESREGFTSVAESSGIPAGLVGGAVVVVSGAILLADVLVLLVHAGRRSSASSSEAAMVHCSVASSTTLSLADGQLLCASASFTKSQ